MILCRLVLSLARRTLSNSAARKIFVFTFTTSCRLRTLIFQRHSVKLFFVTLFYQALSSFSATTDISNWFVVLFSRSREIFSQQIFLFANHTWKDSYNVYNNHTVVCRGTVISESFKRVNKKTLIWRQRLVFAGYHQPSRIFPSRKKECRSIKTNSPYWDWYSKMRASYGKKRCRSPTHVPRTTIHE